MPYYSYLCANQNKLTMTTFPLVTTIISLALFAGFVGLGIRKFGLLPSYSAYSSKWNEAVPIHNMNLWSIVTIAAALLLVPAMVERGQGNPWQFLGFFAPLYLVLVGFTPEWEANPTQHKVHVIGAISCAAISAVWLAVICHLAWLIGVSFLVMLCAAFATKSIKTCYVFWLEMTMFATVYVALIVP